MFIESNQFGQDTLYEIDKDVKYPVYFRCTACMSILAEALSWANANMGKVTTDIKLANSIVLLGCQVTDLSVLNDLKELEFLQLQYPTKQIYISGCLSRRFDIQLPNNVKRMENACCDGQEIYEQNIVSWANPFWVKKYRKSIDEQSTGNLVRHRYPIRISVGCSRNCAYCTIRTTRGPSRELTIRPDILYKHPNALLVADSPSSSLLSRWINVALNLNTPIALRNVEPQVALKIWRDIRKLYDRNLLDVLHVPIQSDIICVLEAMKRNVTSTLDFIHKVGQLKNTLTATNVILDYYDLDKNIEYCNPTWRIHQLFDVVNWNPYWNGKWNRKHAEMRWKHYFPWKDE